MYDPHLISRFELRSERGSHHPQALGCGLLIILSKEGCIHSSSHST